MKTELIKWVACVVILTALCLMCYFLGRSHAEIKIVKEKGEEIIKEVEVIKYVDKKKAEIWAKPNASDSELVELFMRGEL